MLPGSWEGHRDFTVGDEVPQEQWQALDARFRRLYPSVLTGRAAPAELQAVAAAMGLTPALRHDRRHPVLAPAPLSDGLLADITESALADVGVYAQDRVLGPLGELRCSRSAVRACGAVLAFARLLPQALRPIDKFFRERPRPPLDLRSAIKATELCPPMLWRPVDGGLEPMLPLAPRFRPPGPVLDVPAGPAVIGRATPTRDGRWWLACALPLPGLPDPDPLVQRLTWELWRMRRHELRLTWEDLLRERAEVLTRSACEACFEAGTSSAATGPGWRWPEW